MSGCSCKQKGVSEFVNACDGGACPTGGNVSPGPCYVCDPCAATRVAARMAAWAWCEPDCGGACPPGVPPWLQPLCEGRSIIRLADGSIQVTGGTGAFVLPADVACCPYGHHFGAMRRDPLLSPTDGASIINSFDTSTIIGALEFYMAGPGGNNWYAVVPTPVVVPGFPLPQSAIGPLGLSHVFCIDDFSVSQSVAAAPAIDVTGLVDGVAAAGVRAACSLARVQLPTPAAAGADAIVTDKRGSYEVAVDWACKARPGSFITANRCRCERPVCGKTPAGGGELYLLLMPPPAVGETYTGTLRVHRCDWLLEAHPTICPSNSGIRTLNSIMLMSATGATIAQGLTYPAVFPGNIPPSP
jgi:hypothetical protein